MSHDNNHRLRLTAAPRHLLVPRWLGVTCSVVTGIMTGLPLGLLLGVLALTPTTPVPPPSKPSTVTSASSPNNGGCLHEKSK
jgi:uncharacterized membrane protein